MDDIKYKLTKRIVHYYELHARVNNEYIRTVKYDTTFQALLGNITKLVKNRDTSRYQQIGEKYLFINEMAFVPTATKNIVTGKLLCIRKDTFPGIIDRSTDITRDIQAQENEDIFDITHFVIQETKGNSSDKITLSIEYNQFGARIGDLKYYLEALGKNLTILHEIEIVPILKDSLRTMKNRMGLISKFIIKIQTDNIPLLQKIDTDLATSLALAAQQFDQEYVTLALKYDVRKMRQTPTAYQKAITKSKDLIDNFINYFTAHRDSVNEFEQVEAYAEDSDRSNTVQSFDLLIDKAKDVISVERNERSRAIISGEMFQKMIDKWETQRL